MKTYSINCDMGEGIANEAELMPFINYCNIACGGHTGDIHSMDATIDLAIKNNVKIGAHPSYPDRFNFGRKSIEISKEALISTIQEQIHTLIEIATKKNTLLTHIKAHGALYNDITKNKELAAIYLEAVKPYRERLKLFVPYNSEIETLAIKNNFEIVYEAFADRNYNQDLSLVSRSQSNAVIDDIDVAVQHVEHMITLGKVNTVQNKKVSIKASTFCIHSDTNNALEVVKGIHQLLLKQPNE